MSEPLAEARVLIVPDLSAFSASLKTQLAAQIKVVEGSTVAVASKAAATTSATKAEVQLAGATALETKQTLASARAAAESAAAHAQLARGAGATGLSLLGARGATLAAGSSFLIGAAAVTLLAKSVQGAIDDQETLFRVSRVLGVELGEGSKKWASSLALSFGIADDAALKFEGAIAETLHNVGLLPQQNAHLSQSLVELAADMAAFAHVPVEDTLRALQLAVSGNTRALRQYGVVIQNSEVQQRALNATGKESVDQLTRQELALARVAIIQERTANQVGSFAARSGELSAKTKILTAELDHLSDQIGGALIPILTKAAEAVTGLAIGFSKLFDLFGRVGSINIPFLDDDNFARLLRLKQDLADLPPGLQGVQGAAGGAAAGLAQLGGSVAGLIGPMTAARQAALDLRAALAGLGAANVNLLRAQAEGAPLSTQLSAAQAALAQASAASAAADALSPAKGKATAQKAALEAELQARNAVSGIQGQIDAANRKDVVAAKKARKTAQEIADEQDRQLAFEQQRARGFLDIAAAHAQHTKSLTDDVKVLQDQLALANRQIAEAAKIHDAQTRLNTIQQLQLQAVQLQNDIDDKLAEQLRLRRQRKLDALDAAVNLASLDAQIAEARGQPKAEIAALLRENAALERSRKAWQGNTQKQKEITLEIARNNAQIKELKKEKDKNKDLGASLAFQFLQTQQGFAANLLGNLLSGAATAGTVGGTSGAISTPTVPFGDSGNVARRGLGDFNNDVSAAARVNAGVRGASSSQMSVLIGIQNRMLAAIQGGAVRTSHPEAARAWAYTATEMLNTGW